MINIIFTVCRTVVRSQTVMGYFEVMAPLQTQQLAIRALHFAEVYTCSEFYHKTVKGSVKDVDVSMVSSPEA